jgi:glycosyltransferase involved in cell wall biosynthesis
MKIIGISLMRNEAGFERWLLEWIHQMKEICDQIIVLDDFSTDNTVEKLDRHGITIINSQYFESKWETNELELRKRLFNSALNLCEIGDCILNLDGDEIFSPYHLNYIRYCIKSIEKYDLDSIGFKLFDMWTATHYREDKWWTAHNRYWPMLIRKMPYDYQWSNKKLHCGRFPLNAATKMLPTQIPIMHMGWSNKELRKYKYDRYMRIDGDRKDGLIEQYESIMDTDPNLIPFDI